MLDSVATENPDVKTQNQDDQDGVSAAKSEERPVRPAVLTPIAGQTNIQVCCYLTSCYLITFTCLFYWYKFLYSLGN